MLSGGDFAGAVDELLSKRAGDLANFAQRVAYHWKAIPVPVIAALHGNVLGGACRSRSAPTSESRRPMQALDRRGALGPDPRHGAHHLAPPT